MLAIKPVRMMKSMLCVRVLAAHSKVGDNEKVLFPVDDRFSSVGIVDRRCGGGVAKQLAIFFLRQV